MAQTTPDTGRRILLFAGHGDRDGVAVMSAEQDIPK